MNEMNKILFSSNYYRAVVFPIAESISYQNEQTLA